MLHLVTQAINNLKPEVKVEVDQDLVSDGVLDSFDLLLLVTELESVTGLEIPGVAITPENFFSVSTIARLLIKIKGEAT